jgi:tetratricopeptide (TPR) repeat protein
MKIVAYMFLFVIIASGALALGVIVGPLTADQVEETHSAQFYNALGYELSGAGRTVEAQAAFTKAVELDPSYENARSNLATTAFKNADYLTGIEQLRVLTSRAPDSENYQFDLAQNLVHQARFADTDGYTALGRLEEAASLFEALGDFPHAGENARIVRSVIAEATA